MVDSLHPGESNQDMTTNSDIPASLMTNTPCLYVLQANDFGSEVIPGAKDLGMHVQAYLYDGYWEDIGTIEAFYQANLALTKNPKPDYRSAIFVSNIAAIHIYMSMLRILLGSHTPYCQIMSLEVNVTSTYINSPQVLSERPEFRCWLY